MIEVHVGSLLQLRVGLPQEFDAISLHTSSNLRHQLHPKLQPGAKPLSSKVNRHIQSLVCFSQISQPVRFFGRPNTTSTWFNSRVLTKQTYPSVLGHIFHLRRPTRQRTIGDAPSKNLSNQPIYGPIGKLRAIRNLVSLRV